MQAKPWGGRFTEATDRFVEEFTASIEFDQRLWKHDIMGSIAHAKMLAKQGIITPEDEAKITAGLEEIYREIEEGKVEFSIGLEDIHMNVESRLVEKIGDAGKRLHTGRSRNDQVALDIRFYLRDEISRIKVLLKQLQKGIVGLAEGHIDCIMPGFTHLQPAEPSTLGYRLAQYAQDLLIDWRLGERHFMQILNELDVPCGPIMSSEDLFNDEHVLGRLGQGGILAVSDGGDAALLALGEAVEVGAGALMPAERVAYVGRAPAQQQQSPCRSHSQILAPGGRWSSRFRV